MNEQQIQATAAALHAAERERRQIRSPSLEHPDMTLRDAYAIQSAWVALKRAEGRQVRGHKIGLTSRAMQRAMRIDTPDYGTLLDDMFFTNGATLEAARFTDPRIEVELAFVLKQTLHGTGVTVEQVLAATDYVVPALELIAARTHRVDPDTGQPRGVLDTISDNAANAALIVGDMQIDPFADLRWVAAVLYQNGVIEESGVAAAVLDHPANGIAWLAHRLADHGVALEAGELILAGSFTRPVAVRAGDRISVDYRDYGTVSCQFA